MNKDDFLAFVKQKKSATLPSVVVVLILLGTWYEAEFFF